ncbi:NACHT domain-containing protein [Flavobacterium sp. 1355]|uniref:NACHT domain-containing protein n=1 Tax=Flavobacterium sp. 1355 TaxID=2806571 RepID=UPI001AEB964C|nr:hypothetical protein [Flavobacterium sp. 1355]MBP1222357.1 hypothetical protein [Flavobacterium sp. 1355]
MPAATKINWSIFKMKNENYTKSFEDLCYHLFCRKYGITEGIRTDYNQTGIETEPIKDQDGKSVGFQSKFFDNKLSDTSSVSQIIKSIGKAKNAYQDLKTIIIYTHQAFGSENPAYKLKIELAAKPIKIEWFVSSNFEGSLFHPGNLDLAQLYFGLAQEIVFLKNTLPSEMFTFLSSPLCISLPLSDENNTQILNFHNYILKSKQKIYLLTGGPGSGKSISLYRLFQNLSGMNTGNTTEMIDQLTKQKAIPVLINLRNCITDSIENIIKSRLDEYNVGHGSLGFIFLFDGLDELPEQKIDYVLSYINELNNKKNTIRIVFSCRSGSYNKLKTKSHFNTIELRICELNLAHIKTFFHARGNTNKLNLLEKFIVGESAILGAIDDILLINLFYDTIEELHEDSTIIDLLDKKVNLLLKNNNHKKNIDHLNLLNPKEDKIILLHEDIAYHFHQKFQFRFTLPELQNLINIKLPQRDSISINHLINYLIELFFEHSFAGIDQGESYIYQHRKYQEYFFAKKLKKEFDKNPGIIRKLKVVSNSDFFEDMFLPYLKASYKKENNLIGFIKLNLIKLYSGNDSSWGGDDPYYSESNFFIKTLAAQSDRVFEQLYNDENIGISEKISSHFPSHNSLEELIYNFLNDKKKYNLEDKLIKIYNKLAHLLEVTAILHQNNRRTQALEIFNQFNDSLEQFKKSNLKDYLIKSNRGFLNDPFWEKWESFIYIHIFIKNNDLLSTFETLIVKNYSKIKNEDLYYSAEEKGKEKLVKSFIRVVLNFKQHELISLLDVFENYEFTALLELLADPKYLHLYFENTSLKSRIDQKIKSSALDKNNVYVLFFKKISGNKLNKQEKDFIEQALKDLRSETEYDIKRRKKLHEYAVTAFNIDEFSFEIIFKEYRNDYNYYHEISLYSSILKGYLEILSGKDSLINLIAKFKKYNNIHLRDNLNKYFKSEFAYLWAAIFSITSIEIFEKKQLIKLFLDKNHSIDIFEFYSNLCEFNPRLCKTLLDKITLENIKKIEKNKDEDMMSNVNNQFRMAILYSEIDDQKAINHITTGITNSLLKHGWRKDTIICYNLVDALGIIWRNQWYNKNKLLQITKKVYELTIKAATITDGKFTWKGPYYFIEILSKYDVKLAQKYRNKFRKKEVKYSPNLSTPIILSMIKEGYGIEEIETEIKRIPLAYNHLGNPTSQYHIERFKTYLAMAVSYFLSEVEQAKAFENAHNEISDLLSYETSHVDWKNELSDEIPEYKRLCAKYKKKYEIPAFEIISDTENAVPELLLMEHLSVVKNKTQLKKWYTNFDRDIDSTIENFDSWQEIVDVTYTRNENISMLLELMKRDYFPSYNSFTNGAKFYHLALAAALGNMNTRQEALDFLFDNSGHGGFLHILESYEILRDEKMAKSLFKHYLRFCDFLVN